MPKIHTYLYRNMFRTLILFGFCLIYMRIYAQDYNFRHITSAQGLPQSVVTDIYKDSRGFVWITTWNGVSRYDGIHIKNNEEIANGFEAVGNMNGIKEDIYGNIWMGSNSALVKYSYEENRFYYYTSKNSGTKYSQMYLPRLLVEDKILMSYDESYFKIFEADKGKFIEFELTFDIQNNQFVDPINPNLKPFANKLVLVKVIDQKTYLFLLKKNGASFYWKKIKIGENLEDIALSYNGGDSLIYFNMPRSLIPDAKNCFGLINLRTGMNKEAIINSDIQTFSEYNGNYFIGTYGDGIIKLDKNTFREVSRIKYNDGESNGLLSNNICFIKKIDNQLWAVSWGKGINISSFKEEVLSYYFTNSEAKKNNASSFIRGIVQDKNQNFWLATHESGIVQLDNNLKFKKKLKDTASKEYPSLFYSEKHKLFFSNYGIECHDIKSGITSSYKIQQGFSDSQNNDYAIYSFALDTAKNLYAANVQTIFQIDTDKSRYNPLQFYEYFPAYEYFYISSQNRVISSTVGYGICEFEMGDGCYSLVRRLGINLFLRNVYEENDSIYWLATIGGLFQYNVNTYKIIRHFTQKDGLPNDVIYALASDDFGNLWMSTNKGIAKINLANKQIKRYKQFQNEENREYNRNSVCKAKDGSILFGSVDGITKVRPWLDVSPQYDAGLYFTKVKSKEEFSPFKHQQKSDALLLDKGTSFIEFNFQVVEINNAHSYSLRYKLHGINEDWVYVQNPGSARFSNLSPNQYQMTIEGLDVNGHPIHKPVDYYFTIPPFWYQTALTKILAVMLIALALAYIYYLRIKNKFQKESIELEKERVIIKEREHLLADLHDDIGASLSSIHINSELVDKIQDSKPEVAKKLVNNISREAKEISSKLSDFIWSLKQENKEGVNIKSRILDFQSQLIGEKNIRFNHVIEEDSIINDPFFTKNLLLIIKEALNNISKYAGATEVTLTLRRDNDRLVLQIMDNGAGFDYTSTNGGNGLSNMKKRCESTGGRFKVDSKLDVGTTILCEWNVANLSK